MSEQMENQEPYHHGNLRPALLEAAMEILNQSQNWDFSLREVARRAGVSHAAPYKHFANKQELLAALAAHGYDLLRQAMLANVEPGQNWSERLKHLGVAYVRFGVQHPAHYRLMFGTAFFRQGESLPVVVAQAANLARQELRQTLEEGCGPEARSDILEIAVTSAWSLVHGLTTLLVDNMITDDPIHQEALASQVCQTLVDGLKTLFTRAC